mgnify:FL=1
MTTYQDMINKRRWQKPSIRLTDTKGWIRLGTGGRYKNGRWEIRKVKRGRWEILLDGYMVGEANTLRTGKERALWMYKSGAASLWVRGKLTHKEAGPLVYAMLPHPIYTAYRRYTNA